MNPTDVPRRRRLRATALLRCVIAIACVGAIVGVAVAAQSFTWTAATVVACGVLWFLAIETDGLPVAIEHFLVSRAENGTQRVWSIWFIDLDEEERCRTAAFLEDTEDNPTLR